MLESDLASVLGVPRTQLRKFREVNPKMTYKNGREIHWTDDGVAWVKQELEIPVDEAVEPRKYSAYVTRSDFPNRKLVQVVADVKGMREVLTVRVRDAALFSKHMQVEIKPDGNGWALTRQPRQRGRF